MTRFMTGLGILFIICTQQSVANVTQNNCSLQLILSQGALNTTITRDFSYIARVRPDSSIELYKKNFFSSTYSLIKEKSQSLRKGSSVKSFTFIGNEKLLIEKEFTDANGTSRTELFLYRIPSLELEFHWIAYNSKTEHYYLTYLVHPKYTYWVNNTSWTPELVIRNGSNIRVICLKTGNILENADIENENPSKRFLKIIEIFKLREIVYTPPNPPKPYQAPLSSVSKDLEKKGIRISPAELNKLFLRLVNGFKSPPK